MQCHLHQAKDISSQYYVDYYAIVPLVLQVDAWLDSVVKEEAKPYLRSQIPPAKQKGPVIVVVGKTFEQIVMDETKVSSAADTFLLNSQFLKFFTKAKDCFMVCGAFWPQCWAGEQPASLKAG